MLSELLQAMPLRARLSELAIPVGSRGGQNGVNNDYMAGSAR